MKISKEWNIFLLPPRKKIILSFTIPALIAAGVVALFLHFSLTDSAIKRWGPDNRFLINTLKRNIIQQIESSKNVLIVTAKNPSFSSLPFLERIDRKINGLPENIDSEKRDIMESLIRDFGTFSVLFLLSPNGDHYISHPFNVQRNLRKFNLADRSYFMKASKLKKPVVSDSFIGADGVPAVAINVPVLNSDNEIIAHLGGVFHLRKLSEIVDSNFILPFDAGFIIDRKGSLIAHTDIDHLTKTGKPSFTGYSLVHDLISNNTGRYNISTKIFADEKDEVKYLATSSRLDNGWSLVLLLRESSIIESVHKQVLYVTLLVFLMLFGISSIGIYFAAIISRKWEKAENKLRQAHNELEEKVLERTEELMSSEIKLRTMFESSRDAIGVSKLGIHQMVNPAYTKMFGYNRNEELIGGAILDCIAQSEHEKIIKFAEARKRGDYAPNDYETLGRRKDGSQFSMKVHVSIYIQNDEEYTLVTLRDITENIQMEDEKKKLQEQLVQSQKMEAIGTLAGGIAHEFNNMLGVIMGYTELTFSTLPEDSNIKENLQNIMIASRRVKENVEQILAFSRKSEQKKGPVNIEKIIKETITFLQAFIPKSIEIKYEIDTGLKQVFGNATQINQVLINLCTNAAYAMNEEGGLLDIGLKKVVLKKYKSKTLGLKPGIYQELTISDTGCGMKKELIDRIFEPYFTTKKSGEGTGMGLAVVYGIVQSHKGKIKVNSKPGKGTVFTVYFPVWDKAKGGELFEDQQLIIKGSNKMILFVDDELALANLGSIIIKKLGYQVESRTSSVKALETFKTYSDKFDLIISDMAMPNMTGVKLAEEIHKIRSDIPVIICTGFSSSINLDNFKEKGISALLMKPLSKRELAETISKVLKNN